MTVYLMRHAETPPRPGKPSDGDTIGITPAGQREARAKGQWLKAHRITTIITSPLARARETAEELSREGSVPITADERAREFVATDVGPPEYKILRDKARSEREWAGERGESFNMSLTRLTALLDSLPNDGSVLIVTHELLLQNFLMSLGAPRPPHLDHLGIITVEKNAEGWQVQSITPGRTLVQKALHRLFG